MGLDLRGVVTRLLDLVQIRLIDVAGNIFAVEHRAIKALDLDLAATDRFDQVRQVLIDQPVSADQIRHVLGRTVVCNQLVSAWHVDAVDVREAHRRSSRAEVDVFRAGFAGHLDDLLARGATHDRVVDQHHVLAAEFQLDGVELLAHRLLARCLARHDKSTADVTVLDEAFAEFHAEVVRQFQCRGTAGVRNRDNHVDVVLWTLAQDFLGEFFTHAQTGLIDRHAVDDRIRTRQINVLEDAGGQRRIGRALTGVQLALFSDVDRFARRQVANQGETEHVQGNAFRGDHVLNAFVGVTLAEHDRADAVRVTETDNAVTGDHRDHRVTADATVVHVGHGGKHVFFGRLQLAALGQLVSEHVQQHFRVGTGVDVTQVGFVDLFGQLFNVGQVTVMRQGDAVRRVDVKRLSLGRSRAARGRVTDVADTHVADQTLHVTLLKHVTHQAIVLAQEQPAIMAGHDTGSVLAAVLEHG